jgi:hypothetical protein
MEWTQSKTISTMKMIAMKGFLNPNNYLQVWNTKGSIKNQKKQLESILKVPFEINN